MESPIARAYDLIAPDYEAQLARNPVAVEMRRRLHRHFDRAFRPGDRVLDFTAGTGIDALYLAARGISVTALDASPGMLVELKRGAAPRGLAIDARVLAAERLSEAGSGFDGAISTFGGLNTIADMSRLACHLAGCVKPHGRVILHVLNAFCLWQAVTTALGRGGVRSGVLRVGETGIRHTLYRPGELGKVFAPYFRLRGVYGLSVIAAPAVVVRWPRWARRILQLDAAIGTRFAGAGDFFVMDLERRDESQRTRER